MPRADADVERQPLRLEDDSDRGEGDVAVGGHQPVQHDVVQVKEEGPHGGRQTDPEEGRQQCCARQAVPQRKVQDGVVEPQDGHDEIGEGDRVGQGCCQAGAQDLMAGRQQDEHEERVQDDIDDAAHGDGEARLFGTADVAQQVPHGHGGDGRRGADDDDAGAVLAREIKGLPARPQGQQERPHENTGHDGEKEAHESREPDAEGGDSPRLFRVLFPHQTGNQGPAAGPRDVGDRDADIEDGQDQGRARHHVGIVGPPDIEGVRHIVDQDDQLRDHRRDRHLGQGLGHRHHFKEIFVPCFLLLDRPVLPGALVFRRRSV